MNKIDFKAQVENELRSIEVNYHFSTELYNTMEKIIDDTIGFYEKGILTMPFEDRMKWNLGLQKGPEPMELNEHGIEPVVESVKNIITKMAKEAYFKSMPHKYAEAIAFGLACADCSNITTTPFITLIGGEKFSLQDFCINYNSAHPDEQIDFTEFYHKLGVDPIQA